MLRRLQLTLALVLLTAALLMPVFSIQAADGAPRALVLTATGPVTPVMAGYLDRGLAYAAERNFDVVIVELNTPGGSVDIMTAMVTSIRNSAVPVVVYVSPSGAMAGSAGTVITLAGHLSAMAPQTIIGAASPVGSQGEDIEETMDRKVKEALRAQVRGLMVGRPAEAVALAEDTIESARAVTDQEALAVGMVDIGATDVNDLLLKIDGSRVTLASGEAVILSTAGAQAVPFELNIVEQVLGLLTNPNIVFLLLAIGVQAILIELSSPGGWVAGTIGVTCLLLAFYGLGVLPVNWFGLIFLLLSFVLFILDIKAPTHGALTAAGTAAFIAGALILFNSTRVAGFPAVSVPLVVGTGLVIAASFSAAVSIALKAQKRPILMGKETLVGRTGVARSALDPRGMVQVAGEAWGAERTPDSLPVAAGDRVEVVQVSGVRLIVRRVVEE